MGKLIWTLAISAIALTVTTIVLVIIDANSNSFKVPGKAYVALGGFATAFGVIAGAAATAKRPR